MRNLLLLPIVLIACGLPEAAPEDLNVGVDGGPTVTQPVECTPLSCNELMACGVVDDGCGVSIDCGECALPTICYEDVQEVSPNACGSCGELDIEPGGTCGCGSPIVCSDSGYPGCSGTADGGRIELPDTTDGNDDWIEVDGVLESDGSVRVASQVVDIVVEDTFTGILSNSVELEREGTAPLEVCVSRIETGYYGGSGYVKCGLFDNPLATRCCKQLDADETILRFDTDTTGGTNPTDSSEWHFSVKTLDKTDSCVPYTLRVAF